MGIAPKSRLKIQTNKWLSGNLLIGLFWLLWITPLLVQGNQWSPEDIMKTKSVSNVRVSPDGKRVVYTVTRAVMTEEKSEYLTQIYIASTDGRERFQFTFGEKSSTNPRWSPDGKWIAFTSSRSGKNNLWRIRVDGGEAEPLTDVKTAVSDFRWAPDGSSIAFLMKEPPTKEEEKKKKGKDDARVLDENFKMTHLWLVSLQKDSTGKYPVRQLTKGNFNVSSPFVGGFDWSPDGKEIVFAHTPTPRVNDWTKSDISIVDVETGDIRTLVASGAAESSPMYSPNGKWIAYVRSDDPPSWAFTGFVYLIPSGGGKAKKLATTFDQQPRLIGWSADGKYIYYSETRGTVTRISVLPIDGKPYRDMDNGQWVIGSIDLNRSRKYFGFTLQNTVTAPEAYVSSVKKFAPVKVSAANVDLPDYPLPRTEVIRWKSVDGLEIEGLLTYPVDYQASKKYPLLLIVHGGPTGVFTQSFIANRYLYPIPAFVSRGYAILRCNIRGSSGYGKDFRYANYNDWGGKDYQDLMAGVNFVIQKGIADPQKLGVMGWSYGGYMTSWIITQTHRFKAASVGAGVTDLVSFTGTTDVTGFIPDYFNGDFWNNLDAYLSHSAIFNIKGVSTPTLILHGERDERVPLGQGLELYHALQRQGVQVKMVIYPRTPHGPREPKLLMDVMQRNLEWFEKWIKEEKTD